MNFRSWLWGKEWMNFVGMREFGRGGSRVAAAAVVTGAGLAGVQRVLMGKE